MYDEIVQCPMRHKNGNCLPCGGFCLAVSREVCKALRTAYQSGYYSGITEPIRGASERGESQDGSC